jgi:hypothetical protein
MKQQLSTFIIAREDQAIDPVTLVTEGLSIGRSPDSELVLNHPTVSRLHAGIKEVGGSFYVFNLSPSNSTTVNGRLVEEREAITDGDIVQIGPFFLNIGHDGKSLTLRVIYQTAVRIGDTEVQGEGAEPEPAMAATATTSAPVEEESEAALAVFWDKRKREAGKITRPSPLRPHAPPRLGKARFNWAPTRDLVRPWPFAILTWAAIVVAVLTVVAAFSFTTAFSPSPVSNPHTRTALSMTPAIANRPNGNTCTSCHAVKASMNDACASCHQTTDFVSTITPPHQAAGLGCTTCHMEHRGANFRPGPAALNASFAQGGDVEQTCAGCHNDNNKRLYNGKAVHTPHGGTFGYPVTNEHWTWMGIEQKELAQKPEQVKQILASWPAKNEDQKLSGQFHALHLHRVRAIGGLPANSDGELSCSSCHKSWGASLDRTTPRQTCAVCHNGYVDPATNRAVIAQDKPNCNSCHVQHVEDKRHWNPSLISQPPQTAGTQAAHDAGLIARAAQ